MQEPVCLWQIINVIVAVCLYVLSANSARLPNSDVPLIRSAANHVVMNSGSHCVGIHKHFFHFLVCSHRQMILHDDIVSNPIIAASSSISIPNSARTASLI